VHSVRSTTSRRYSQGSRWYCSSTIQRFRHSLHPLRSSKRQSCRILQRPQTCENERMFHRSSKMGGRGVSPFYFNRTPFRTCSDEDLISQCGRSGSRASELDFPNTFDSRKGGQLFDAGMSMATSPPSNVISGRVSPPSARSSRETTAVSEMRDRLSARKRSGLDFDEGEEDVDQREVSRTTASRSPTPRRRRSDSTRTEVAEEAEEEEEEQENRPLQPATSSSPATTRQRHSSSSSNPFRSSDQSPFHALSEVPPRQTDEKTAEQRRAEEEEKKKELLRQQTHLLLAEMQGKTTEAGKNGRTRTLAKKVRKSFAEHISPLPALTCFLCSPYSNNHSSTVHSHRRSFHQLAQPLSLLFSLPLRPLISTTTEPTPSSTQRKCHSLKRELQGTSQCV